jgi:nucleoid DNA-binding protein
MAERMSKSETLAKIAEKTDLKKKDVAAVIDALAELAHREAKNTFQVPGLGIVMLRERPARKMIMRFGPKAGQEIEVPAKKALKFRFSKVAKDAILGGTMAVKKDDLAIIEGIGPKIAAALNKAGIKTFKQLGDANVAKLKEILADAKFPADPATWAEQSKLAAAGKMDELKKLQDALQGGRRA